MISEATVTGKLESGGEVRSVFWAEGKLVPGSEVWQSDWSQVMSARCQFKPCRNIVQLSSLWNYTEPANELCHQLPTLCPTNAKQGYLRLVSYFKALVSDLTVFMLDLKADWLHLQSCPQMKAC